jgi:hypothetical protein
MSDPKKVLIQFSGAREVQQPTMAQREVAEKKRDIDCK